MKSVKETKKRELLFGGKNVKRLFKKDLSIK